MSNLRHARVAKTLRQVLAELIIRDLKDPRVDAGGRITVTQVELSSDMSTARVYVEIAATGKAGDAALAALKGGAGRLRGSAGRAMNLKKTPQLRFVRDHASAMSAQLTAIVREDQERAQAAGRADGEPEPQTSEGRQPESPEEPS